MSATTHLPRHRRPGKMKALIRGFDSLTLDPSPRLRSLREEIEGRNTVEEAWTQTGRLIAEAMESERDGSR